MNLWECSLNSSCFEIYVYTFFYHLPLRIMSPAKHITINISSYSSHKCTSIEIFLTNRIHYFMQFHFLKFQTEILPSLIKFNLLYPFKICGCSFASINIENNETSFASNQRAKHGGWKVYLKYIFIFTPLTDSK